jgi:hypothetical protein
MSASTHRFAEGGLTPCCLPDAWSFPTVVPSAAGMLLTALLLGACGGEDADQHANYPRAPGSDSFQEMVADEDAQPGGSPLVGSQGGAVAPVPEGFPAASADDTYPDDDPSALTDFRDTLDPHGQWLDDANYGTMWQPSPDEVGADFAPYVSVGHWAYDDTDDYVWMSDYGWGWAPFHYGRWAYGSYGWGWIPGRTYAPAWVSWRTGYPGFGYVGWAPLPPTWGWRAGGATYAFGAVPPTPYVFCGVHDLFAPRGVSGRIVTSPSAVHSIAGQTHPYAPSMPAVAGGAVGRVPAHPTVSGPTPQSLHLAGNEVRHVASSDAQLARATQFSRPSTAVALGGHTPGGARFAGSRTATSFPGGAVAGHAQLGRASMPAYGAPARSYYNHTDTAHLGGSYYGRGGSYRSYSGSYSAPSGASAAEHGARTLTSSPSAPSHYSNGGGHFGGHYGGGAHGGGGHR